MDIIIDELIRSKRKTVSISITRDAKVIVKVPLKFPAKEIDRIIEEKKSWIIRNKSRVLERIRKKESINLSVGGQFLFLGESYTISTDYNEKSIKIKNGLLVIPSELMENIETALAEWCRKQGKIILKKRLEELSHLTGIKYSGCSITGAKSRWGSCSYKNRINLSWRLILANKRAIDYVIIHELCHVLHKNHSKAFWQEVEKHMPDYKNHKKWLKDNAFILDAFM
ncbi:MAG: M48 family metallopeptidase [Clostridiaceae bacterium]|nr:M48 family metallopeptidase [Clostridiaceae bacterium]